MSINFMASVTICSDFGAKKIKSVTVCIVCQFLDMMGWDQMPVTTEMDV